MRPIDVLLSSIVENKDGTSHPKWTANEMPPVEYLMECFEYDKSNGLLVWKKRPDAHFSNKTYSRNWNKRFAGKVAGTHHGEGYRSVAVNAVRLKCHRVCYALGSGIAPDTNMCIDHINGDTTDNSFLNLRLATVSENTVNFRGGRSDSVHGVRGIIWKPQIRKWEAWVTDRGDRIYLGVFKKKSDAEKIASSAREKLYGDFYKSQNS